MADNTTRSHNRLTSLRVKRAKRPGMYADGGSLYLRVAPGGSKQWIFRYTSLDGRMRDMSLGAVHTFSLAETRERATQARKLRADGIDPLDYKRAQRAALAAANAKKMTFEQCALGFIKDNEAEWGNAKHRYEWEATLRRYVYPTLGSLPIEVIDTPLLLRVVKPLWQRVPTTASRVLGRIHAVIGWATVHHYRSGDNPARWQGHLEHALPALSKVAKVEHHAALPYAQVGAFMAKLRKDSSIGARCLEFITLTACRLSEVLYAEWSEIDFDNRVWVAPASRMKANKEHRVPLSTPALAVLKAMQVIRHSDYIFPGNRPGHGHAGAARQAGRRFRHYGAWPALDVPRLGRRAHELPARGCRDGARARHPRRGRGGLPTRRLVRQTPQADGRLGRLLRQGRDGQQGGCDQGEASLKAKPDPGAVMADLRVLESKLLRAFKTESNDPDAMQLRYSVALTAVANFLWRAGIDEEIAHKFVELASGVKEGSLPFLCPPKAGGRTYDSQVIWNYRCYVIIGLECILRSGKMKLQEAARYIAKEYPVFNRLKRNPSHSLATSIISWRRYFNEGKGYEHLRACMDMGPYEQLPKTRLGPRSNPPS